LRLLSPRPPRVEKLERRRDVPSLVRALDYRDIRADHEGNPIDNGEQVRARAVAALSGIDSNEAHNGIVRALADSSDDVRLAAVEALRQRGSHGAVEPLADAAASWTSGELVPSRDAVIAALESRNDADVPLRVAAALVARPEELAARDCEILRRLADSAPDGVRLTVSYLLSVLGDAARGTRAAQLLVALAPESVPALLETLSDPEKTQRAALALGHAHAKEAVEPLCRILLESDDARSRRSAAWALGEIRDPVAVEALLLATSDRDYEVRADASAAFDKFGNGGMALAIAGLLRPQLVSASGDATSAIEDDALAALGEEARAIVEAPAHASPSSTEGEPRQGEP